MSDKLQFVAVFDLRSRQTEGTSESGLLISRFLVMRSAIDGVNRAKINPGAAKDL